MASMINSVRIQFADTGLDKLLQHQQKMRDNAKATYELAKKELQALEKTGAGKAQLDEKKKEVKSLEKDYKALEATLKGMGAEFNTIKNAIENIDSIGPKMVNQLLNSLKRFHKNAGSLTDDISEKIRATAAIKDVATALSSGFQKGVVDLAAPIKKNASFSELKGIKEQYEQFGKVLAQSSNNYNKTLKLMGERATEAKIKMGEMDGTLKSINQNSSVENIKNYIKGWQEVANYSGATKAQVKNAERNVKSGQQALLSEYAKRAQAGTSTYTPQEVQDAIKGLKDLQQTANLSATAQKKINLAIAEGEENLKRYAAEGKRQVMEKQLQNVSKLSKSALQEQQKYWQEVMNNAVDSKGANAARQNLENINNLLRQHQQLSVQQSGLLNYQQGMGGNIDTLKENIKTLQEYRATLNSTDVSGLTQVDNAIKNMTADLRAANENALLAQNALTTLGSGGALTGTVEDLQKTKSGLLEMRNQVDVTSKEGKKKMADIDKAILSVDSAIRKATMDEQRFKEILKNPQGVYSLNELKVVYDQLEQEIKQAGIEQEDFIEKSLQMKDVKRRMEELGKSLEPQRNFLTQIKDEVKQLLVYHISMDAILSKSQEAFSANLELSDQMVNVQKVTNMADHEVKNLTNSLQALDSREGLDQLMALGEQAGKMGIYNTDGIKGMTDFVEQGQKIIKTLGEEVGGAQAVGDLKKLSDIMDVSGQFGGDIGKSLDALGSSILSVGNNSAASYAPTMEYLSRVGATASNMKATAQQVVALGGALDALKVPAEQGSTALIQIMRGIQNYTYKVARAAKLDPTELSDTLHNEGIYEALQMVLQSIADGQVKIQEVMDVLGSRSKTSAAVARVLASLSDNMELLDKQLMYAREGFDSAREGLSLMTKEFERSNESAAGLWARINNEIKEIYTNSSNTGFIHDILQTLLSIVKAIGSTSASGTILRNTLLTIAAAVTLVKTGLLSTFKSTRLFGGITRFNAAMRDFYRTTNTSRLNILKLPAAFKHAAQASKIFSRAMATMKAGLKGLIALLVTDALFSFIGLMRKAAQYEKDLSKAIHSTSGSLTEEEEKINDIKIALLQENIEQKERVALIKEFNERAGSYLGFMLSEKATAEDIAVAYAKVNAELDKKRQKERIESAKAVIDEKYNKKLGEKETLFDKDIRKHIGDKQGAKLSAELFDYIGKNFNKDFDEVFEGIRRILRKRVLGYLADNRKFRFKQYIDILKERDKEYKGLEERIIGLSEYKEEQANQASEKARSLNFKQILERLEFDEQRKVYKLKNSLNQGELERLLSDVVGYIGSLSEYKGGDPKTDKNLKLAHNLKKVLGERITELEAKKYSSWGVEGKGKDYENMSSENLAKLYDLFDQSETFVKEGIDYKRVFPNIEFPEHPLDIDGLRAFFREEAAKIKEILEERGNNTNANFKWDEDSEAAKEAKQTYEAALAALDAYYKERENKIDIALNNETITEAEAERRKRTLEVEHLQQRTKLRRNAVGELEAEEQKGFEEWWSGVEKLDAVNWERLREQSEEWGKAYRQKQKLGVQKDLSEVEKLMRAHKVKIDKILAEGAPMKELAMEFGSAMDELDMIFGANEKDRSKELASQRLIQLLEWGKNAYELSIDDLKSEMENETHVFNAWYQQLGDDKDRELTAMLMRLQQFNDDLMEVGRKAAKESERIFKTRWEGEIQENGKPRKMQEEDSLLLGEAGVRAGEISEGWRHGGTVLTGDMELDLIQLQIKAKEKYIQALKGEQNAKIALSKQREVELEAAGNEQALAEQRMETANLEMETNLMLADSYTLLNELRQQETEKAIESYNRTFGSLGEMADAFDKFAQSFGEGIFGSKEDRKQAGKDLLSDSLQVMKKLAQQYLIEVATAKITNETKLLLYKQYAAQKQLIDLQLLQAQGVQEINGLKVTEAVANAEAAVDAARGTGKEVAKLGLKGLLIGAAISAGLSLLMGAAMSKINKSKSEVASASGASAGKLTTGMLTYAEGKYPSNYEAVPHSTGIGKYANGVTYNVEGNDGRSYNARYTKSLKTGIYHGAHMAVFSENGDEMVIDSPTLRRMPPRMIADIMAVKHGLPMMMDYGRISEAMNTLSLSRTRSLANMGRRNGIRTYADGNIDEVGGELLAGYNTIGGANGHGNGNDELTKAVKTLNAILASGIGVNMYGQDGLRKSLDKDERWRKRNRLS